ncbi:MAG: BREX system serine/threonine kinase PglW [Micrococcales bacterium]|nr:BREX system serine/threonine kinase PglW [Micrococcales bacterium]
MSTSGDGRWVEVTPSQFPHEAEGLALVRTLLPDEAPFRAWSNFEFRDSHGKWHEVDLLLLGRGRLHLIELKYYSGVLRGDDHRWLRDGKRAEDSPLKLARRKAQYFATKLGIELHTWAAEKNVPIPDHRLVVPFVQESVFLHHERFTSQLSPASAINLYGLDGAEHTSNLPGISKLILEQPHRQAIGSNQESILVDLMARIGLVQRRERRAGSWVIEDHALAEGEGWQEWLASHQVAQQERASIRFQVAPTGASESARAAIRRLAEHEFRIMSHLQHDGLFRPRDFVDSELGVGLVYDYDESWQRLDLWMADQANGVPLTTQLSIVRQIGEALQYAHGNKVVHRRLSPRAIWVRDVPGTDGDVKVRIGDWQASGAVDTSSRTAGSGITSLLGASTLQRPQQSIPASTGEPSADDIAADGDRWMNEGFQAPEDILGETVDRVRIDVFGLGVLTFYIVAGRPAATSSHALKARLRDQSGLDLAVELPQVSTELRDLVLKATHPAPTQRLGDLGRFLELLTRVERAASSADVTTEDPLEATPGSIIGGRFRLERRLGKGSTAVGLLVTDLHATGTNTQRVLKVALHDEAAGRLADEAEVLRGLDSPRLVKLVEDPITVAGRQALVLESAGTETLTEALRARERLSLDLLERYGTDLLDALVVLDKAGIDHRDIKPSNLGIRENRGDRVKHLVLFDFSLTRAAASATSAGTPPYLDPFLIGKRDHWDSAAERYAATVVLFEMATGQAPRYGDGDTDPATIPDDIAITPSMFDEAIAQQLTEFFTSALARDAAHRHHTAEAMRAAWRAIFATDATTEPDETNDQLAAVATLATPLRESGLTSRALSALEPEAIDTVGELLTVDPVRINHLRGVANSTRKQITSRIKQWQARLGDVAAPKLPADAARLTLTDAADLLLASAAATSSKKAAPLVRLILGIGTDLDAFATKAQLAASLPEPVTPARAGQLIGTLQESWAADKRALAVLDDLVGRFTEWLAAMGLVVTVGEAVTWLDTELADPASDDRSERRLAAGLLRLTLERIRALRRADADIVAPLVLRRREGTVTLIGQEAYLLDVAEWVGREADTLVAAAGEPSAALIPAQRAADRLREVFSIIEVPTVSPALRETDRLVRLAAAASTIAAVAATGDLHHRDLSPVTALALTFKDFGGAQHLAPREIRKRVGVRFPALARLPERPRLDALIEEAGLSLVFDDRTRRYRSPQTGRDTTGLESRLQTADIRATSPVATTSHIGQRLEQSLRSRSFLTLGVPAGRLARFIERAPSAYAAELVDVTGVLIESLRSQAETAGLPWDLVRAADAASETSRDRQGLAELVKRSWDVIAAAVDDALAADGSGPVIITEAAPLARYDNMGLLARWTDLGTARRRAVWLIAPQLGASRGASLDGRPVPLASPSQYLLLDPEWIDHLAADSDADSDSDVGESDDAPRPEVSAVPAQRKG